MIVHDRRDSSHGFFVPLVDYMLNRTSLSIVLLLLLFTVSLCFAQDTESLPDSVTVADSTLIEGTFTPQPVTAVTVNDTPNDKGGSIQVSWEPSPDDAAGLVDHYTVERKVAGAPDSEFEVIGESTAGGSRVTDNRAEDGIEYTYRVAAVSLVESASGGMSEIVSYSSTSDGVRSSAQWFNSTRIVVLIFVVVLSLLITYYISQAKAGKSLFIRKIAGLEAVDEAVGRATEMGRKIFFIPGTQDMENIQTIAGVTILGRVAKLAAEYECQLEVPVARSLVMIVGREIVKEAYMNAGRPDAFNEDMVRYLTDDQFGYAAAVDGMIVRDKPATIFYMGAFYAESLILAETGNYMGAIQIAGTAMPAQLPFFVAACDYTLIGEELFAASAYLSKEPKLLGSLKGQDVGKGLMLLAILVGVIIQTLGVFDFASLFEVPVD